MQRRNSPHNARSKRGKSSDMSVPAENFVKANLAEESATGPTYREQATMLEQAGFIEEAMLLRFIAGEEDLHANFFEELAKRGIGEKISQ